MALDFPLNIIDLETERIKRLPPAEERHVISWCAILGRATFEANWGVLNAGNTEGLSSDEKAAALFDGWFAIATNEALVKPADTVVAYIIINKDGSFTYWSDPDAVHSPHEVLDALDAAVTGVSRDLVPEKVGGV